MRGQLPKAYLRIDPNIDQHPDMPLIIKLLCAGNRQEPRGSFKTWDHLQTAVGWRAACVLRDRGHVEESDGGRWLIQGWEDWQEGDINVGQRMRLLRERKRERNAAVTPAVTLAVTEGVTEASQNRNSPSEASRRLGVNGLPPTPLGGAAASPPVEVHGNGNGHGTLRPKGLGAATERELERLLSDARVAALVDAWARDRGRTNREIGVARAATAALAGGYLPEQLALVSRLVALAGRQPERFPDRGSLRWAAQNKPAASYVWRSDALDKLIPEAEAWERS